MRTPKRAADGGSAVGIKPDEWTYEGGRKRGAQVAADGFRTRYQGGAYGCMRPKRVPGNRTKLSGTTGIPPQRTDKCAGAFFIPAIKEF